jgi:DNA-directed RNA polymerase specialized sigma24 family protein
MAEYIDRKEFYKLLKEYRKTKSKLTYNKIGKCFLLISQNFLNKCSFINYTPDRKEEMISDAVYYMCRYIDKYDLKKTNPFAYFTTIAKNAFLQYLNDQNKNSDMFTSLEYIENSESMNNMI